MNSQPAYWAIFPVVGFQILEQPSTVGKLIFDRATLLSVDEVREFVAKMPFMQKDGSDIEEVVSEVQMVPYRDASDRVHSVLVVRGYGKTQEENELSARQRAREVIATLSLVFLVRSEFHKTCSALEHVMDTPDFYHVSIDESYGPAKFAFGKSSRAYLTYCPEPPLQLCRSQLADLLSDGASRCLARAILFPRNELDKDLKGPLSSAITFLVEAIHSPTPEMQVVGAVTSMEVLLSVGRSNFDLLRARLAELLGKRTYAKLDVESVLNVRHDIVHDARFVDRSVALSAIKAAVGCVLAYAWAAYESGGRGRLFRLLDWPAEQLRLEGRFKEVKFSSESIQHLDVIEEYQRFKLISYYCSFESKDYDDEKKRDSFAKASLVFSKLNSLPSEDAFERMSKAFTFSECPFESFLEFSRYAAGSGLSGDEIDRQIQILGPRIWVMVDD